MNEKIRLLKADLKAAAEVVQGTFRALDRYRGMSWDEERTIVVAYHLHNLYGAFEDMFQHVAEAFENQVPDRAQWHSQVLRRMTLDVEGVRPRLIGKDSFDCLDELRRFRHVFRTAYAVSLDPQRLQLVWDKSQKLRAVYPADLQGFIDYLDRLEG